MSDPKLPPGFTLDPPPGLPPGFKLDPPPGAVEAGTPLDSALKSQTGDVVSVDTPQGPAQFDRAGRRVLSPDESATAGAAADAKYKQAALTRAASTFNSGGLNIAPYALGAVGAVKRQLGPAGSRESIIESFNKSKDAAQSTVDAADTEAGLGYQLLGKVPAALVGGPASALGRIGLSSALGGGEAFTRSKGDVTTPEGREQLKSDTLGGVGVGAALGVAGEALAYPLTKVAGALRNRAGVNAAETAAQDIRAQTLKGQQLLGSAGAAGSEAQRAIRAVEETLANPNATAEAKLMAERLSQSPGYIEAVNRQRINAMRNFASANANTTAFAEQGKEALTDVVGKAAPVTAARLDPENVVSDVASKAVKSLGQRAALGAVGYAVGNKTGGEVGGVGGALTGAMLAPGALQFMRNTLRNPANMSVAQSALANVPEAISSFVRGGAQAAGRQMAPKPDFSKPKDQRTEEAVQALLDSGF